MTSAHTRTAHYFLSADQTPLHPRDAAPFLSTTSMQTLRRPVAQAAARLCALAERRILQEISLLDFTPSKQSSKLVFQSEFSGSVSGPDIDDDLFFTADQFRTLF